MATAALRYPRENDFDGPIAQAAARYGLPFALVKAIVAVESEFTPAARRGEPSGVTSYGLMQVTPAAAWGERASSHAGAELLDPATNLDRGCAFLASLLAKFGGDEERAASAYNGGDRPAIGFGTRLAAPMTLCLAWKSTARPVGQRTIAQDCASPYTAAAGEFGNQPYVSKTMEHRRRYSGAVALTSDQLGAAATAALGVAVVLLAVRH